MATHSPRDVQDAASISSSLAACEPFRKAAARNASLPKRALWPLRNSVRVGLGRPFESLFALRRTEPMPDPICLEVGRIWSVHFAYRVDPVRVHRLRQLEQEKGYLLGDRAKLN